jgi:LmbE family N-acetylglucosaminyl deacetylase
MLPLRVGNVHRVLCLGAHCDDIEIGCGGSILAWSEQEKQLSVTWVVFSSRGQRRQEALDSAEALLGNVKAKTVLMKDFRDGFVPYIGAPIKEYFEDLKQECSPDLVFAHCRNDLHQDHRLISELTWNTFRNHLIRV